MPDIKNIEEESEENRNSESQKEVNETISHDQIILTPQPETINSKPQIEEMDVQTPHHITHKKKWEEYVLEFLMLFLAVFLGFVAENIRESNADHEREKQYARELYNEF